MFLDVEIKLKKRNKILFSRDSQCLQELINLIQLQNHRTLVMWALDCAKLILEQFEAKYPDERRPRTCLELCETWARGKNKMPIAKQAILDFPKAVTEKINYYYNRLLYWQENTDKLGLDWADFLLDNNRPNKERLLNEKRKLKK